MTINLQQKLFVKANLGKHEKYLSFWKAKENGDAGKALESRKGGREGREIRETLYSLRI